MSDILSRLLLDTKQYDASLSKAKKGSNDFASDVAGKLTGAVGKFAAGIGVAVGGVEAFNKMMDSTQTTGDLMRGTMNSLRRSVDEFFFSVNTGNLSGFISNLGEIASKARDAYGAIDQLGNTQISYGVFNARNQASIAEAQYLAKNKFAPTDVRINAFGTWAKALVNEERNAEALQRELINAATKDVQSRITANLQVSLDDLLRAFETDLLKPSSRSDIKSRAEMGFRNYKANEDRTDWTQQQKDALAEVQRENIITYTLLEKYNDEQLRQIAQQIQQYYQLTSAIKGLGREYNETANEFNNANKGVSGFVPVSSLKGYTVYSGTSEASKNFTQSNVSARSSGVPVVVGYSQYDTDLGRKVLDWMNGKDVPVIKVPIEIEGEDIEEAPLPITKDTVATTDDYVNSLNALSNVMTALNTQTVEGAAGWLSWAGSLMTASAMAVQAIEKVVAAKSAETVVNSAASAAQNPFVGWLLVGGAVASALAALTQVPSFAEGGVVPGSNFRDGIAARLSSGEMVINPADQKKLFDSIHSGNMGGGSSRSVITGEQIVTVINNYGRRTGKGTILKA